MRDLAYVAATAILGVAVSLLSMVHAQTVDGDRPLLGDPPRVPLEEYLQDPPGVTVETLFTGLDVVWSLKFASDGRLFLTEKAGRVRVVSAGGTLDPEPWVTLTNVRAEVREQGLNGLALHPEFPDEPWSMSCIR